ncbi:MAG: hypothetical protein GY928_14810 [Colwellia sp.]|nr:hypothetical protein [Colwellia sp.]
MDSIELYEKRTKLIHELAEKHNSLNIHWESVVRLRKEVAELEAELKLECTTNSTGSAERMTIKEGVHEALKGMYCKPGMTDAECTKAINEGTNVTLIMAELTAWITNAVSEGSTVDDYVFLLKKTFLQPRT